MQLILFTIYRIVEKLLKVRLESHIGHFLFKFFANRFKIVKVDFQESTNDKRTIWGELRFDKWDENFDESFQVEIEKIVAKSIAVGHLAFENSMESSIRGINLITFYKKNPNTYKENKLFSDWLLWTLKLHVLLCPDLYINYKSLLKDESNNHRFYNLLFFCYYDFFVNKTVAIDNLNSFVEKRCVDSEFYDEGSSFYHFGIMHGLGQFYEMVTNSVGDGKLNFSNEIMNMISNRWYFENLNFGDRDGTLINSFKKRDKLQLESKIFVNKKFYYAGNPKKYCFLRLENWTDFGTEGHIHDDAGMFLYSNGEISILDPSIKQYIDEPKFCLRSFHNFPFMHSSRTGMKFKAKFERTPNKSIEFEDNPFELVVKKIEDKFQLIRSLNKETYALIDTIEIGDFCLSGSIEWVFYISKLAAFKMDYNTLLIKNFGEFSFCEGMLVDIEKSIYHPEYQLSEECHRIRFGLEFNNLTGSKNLLEFLPFTQTK